VQKDLETQKMAKVQQQDSRAIEREREGSVIPITLVTCDPRVQKLLLVPQTSRVYNTSLSAILKSTHVYTTWHNYWRDKM
jgi:hypothetical protein